MRDQISELLQQGIDAARAGHRAEARQLFLQVVECDERNSQAWLWLSGVVESDEDRRVALENVLTLDPDGAFGDKARAGLQWLESRQAAPPSPPAGSLDALPAESALPAELSNQAPVEQGAQPETEECPYCEKPVLLDAARCPHCSGALLIEEPKRAIPTRTGLIAGTWLVQAAVDLLILGLIASILTLMMGSNFNSLGTSYVRTFVAGSALAPGPALERTVMPFAAFTLIVSMWSVILAAMTPWRRPATFAVALFLAAIHLLWALSGVALGVISVWVGLLLLGLALFAGTLVLESQADFNWVVVRQTLMMDKGCKSSVDHYSRGSYYLRCGQHARAVLHLERAILLDPHRIAYRVALARACYQLERYEQAAGHIQEALRIKPGDPDLTLFLAEVNAQTNPGSVPVT